MLKAVLFDLDDTLLDWRGFQQDWAVFESALLHRVFDYVTGQKLEFSDFDSFAGEFRNRTKEAWTTGRSNLIAPNLGTILLETAEVMGVPSGHFTVKDYLMAYKWGSVPGTGPFPEVAETLKLLLDKGIKTGIVTNAAQPMWIRDIEIQEHGLLEFFPDCRISAADVGYLKPHPAIFQAALDLLGAKADEAVFVGDNPIADVAGAQSVGMKAVLRVTQPAPPMLSGLIVPDGAINSLFELPPMLDEWFPGWRD